MSLLANACMGPFMTGVPNGNQARSGSETEKRGCLLRCGAHDTRRTSRNTLAHTTKFKPITELCRRKKKGASPASPAFFDFTPFLLLVFLSPSLQRRGESYDDIRNAYGRYGSLVAGVSRSQSVDNQAVMHLLWILGELITEIAIGYPARPSRTLSRSPPTHSRTSPPSDEPASEGVADSAPGWCLINPHFSG
ncbi:unnamed protein product [Pleuronectes platessa]|uniref:Uncharacterized protein n=1 Tax=Pleuronectes platessa TaxID=8262 RepID=A0A9N7YRT5_PLEPL|nr:unnamed protein product [Pleuronectes platessa]